MGSEKIFSESAMNKVFSMEMYRLSTDYLCLVASRSTYLKYTSPLKRISSRWWRTWEARVKTWNTIARRGKEEDEIVEKVRVCVCQWLALYGQPTKHIGFSRASFTFSSSVGQQAYSICFKCRDWKCMGGNVFKISVNIERLIGLSCFEISGWNKMAYCEFR